MGIIRTNSPRNKRDKTCKTLCNTPNENKIVFYDITGEHYRVKTVFYCLLEILTGKGGMGVEGIKLVTRISTGFV